MKQTEKHVQIMTVAAALFAKYGYKKTSIDEIVSAAGISKGLFYHYYTNKACLLYTSLYRGGAFRWRTQTKTNRKKEKA